MKNVDIRVAVFHSNALVVSMAQNLLHLTIANFYMQHAGFPQGFGFFPYARENHFLDTIFPAVFNCK